MTVTTRPLRAGLMSCAAAAALGGAGLAQETVAPESETRASSSQVREVILVTAQKREEAITDVPASISVIGGDQLENLAAKSLADYAAYIPGLNLNSGGTPGQTTITLRGIAPVGPGATVGTYIDDTPLGSSANYARATAFQLDLFPYDIERVEVLRGPQGTLYGASTMGGLLKYVTRTPNLNELTAQVGAEALTIADSGGFGRGVRARANVPLAENVAGLTASFFQQVTPGYIDNYATGQSDYNELTQTGGRLALRWQPDARFTLDLSAMFQEVDSDNNAFVYLDPVTERPIGGSRTAGNVLDEPFSKRETLFAARADWSLGRVDLISATSYATIETEQHQDASFVYGPLFPLLSGGAVAPGLSEFILTLDLEKFTQEFRLASADDGALEWLVGAFYTHEDSRNGQIASALDMNQNSIPGFDPLATVSLPTTYTEYALFANATYALTDRLDVTAGARMAWNDQDYTQISDGALVGGEQRVPGGSSESVFTYLFSTRYHLSDDTMLYGRIASGYRPGGPNVALPGVPPQVESDTLVNYEVGLKSDFWDGRGLFEVSGFWIEWEDIQIATAQGGLSWLTNGGTARSRGIEFNSVISPLDGLQLGLNGAWTNPELTEDAPDLQAVSGDPLPSVPEFGFSLTANYAWDVQPGWTARTGGGLRYVGERQVSFPANPNFFELDSYYSLDLNAEISNGRWALRAYARNLTDEDTYLNAGRINDGLGQPSHIQATALQPRTFGLSLDVSF
ncbi:TonB-dependent receptor [Glycocaulis profundi]|nr:TonB-dependent receptor [Glycocaulis profundi]